MARRKPRSPRTLAFFPKRHPTFQPLRGDKFYSEILEDRAMLAQFVPNELLIQFDPTADAASRASVRAQVSGHLVDQIQSSPMQDAGQGLLQRVAIGNGLSVDAAIQRVRSMRGVVYAEPNWIMQTTVESNDTHYVNGNLWGMYGDDLPTAVGPSGTTNPYGSQAEKAWANGFVGSNDVFIGVIDEGIQFTHPDLIDNVWNNPFDPIDGIDNDGNGRIDDTQGWDFFNNDRTVYDGVDDDHGTHVAGTIGARGGNADGVAGVNWNVTLISAKFLGPGGGTTYDAVLAIDYLTDLRTRHGIHLVATNNSWGGGEYSQALLDAITRAANQDILFVASAGNNSYSNDIWPHYPSSYDTTAGAGYDAVISVAAIDNTGARSFFSNYGESSVDLGAPGSNVYSTLPDNAYGFKSGTSMAAPHVSGALALFAAVQPGNTAAGMRNGLLASVTPTSSLLGNTVTGGRLDVDNLMDAVAWPIAISVGNAEATEGQGGSTVLNFTVTLSSASLNTVHVNYATTDLTAIAGSDYAAVNGEITFAPGETSKNIAVDVFGDLSEEYHETLAVVLSNAENAAIVDPNGIGRIYNDDASISISDVTLAEGNVNYRVAQFTVSLSAPLLSAVSVMYATADGTAVGGNDYRSVAGTLNIVAGATSTSIFVDVFGETAVEGDETFSVNLSSAVGASIADPSGLGTITNDDVNIAIGDLAALEGNSGTNALFVVVTLSTAMNTAVTVNYVTSGGSATAGVDYTATTGTLSFTPGETTKSIPISVFGDTNIEAFETFNVVLSGATLGTIVDTTGVVTIQNDDTSASINSLNTWNEGDTGLKYVYATLSAISALPVTVEYSTADGTASAGSDYVAQSGSATIAAGQNIALIYFSIIDDDIDENDERFYMNLSGATNATLSDTLSRIDITDDDHAHLNVNNVSITEGQSGSTFALFTVSLTYVSSFTVTVNYATNGASATAASDFASTSGTVTFVPGETAKTVSVEVYGDTLVEETERFYLNLSNPSNAVIFDGQGAALIVNDDFLVSIADVSLAEGNSIPTYANLVVSLSSASPYLVTVDFATADGSALASDDYFSATGTVTFGPGETTKVIPVEIQSDLIGENDETFLVNLSNATNAQISDSSAIGTIINDDFEIFVGNSNTTEGDSGSIVTTFTVTMIPSRTIPVTVDYSTVDGTAIAMNDYLSASGTLTFLPGETSKTISVSIIGDAIVEPNETFALILSNAVNAVITNGSGTGLILNDDISRISVADATVTESNASGVSLAFQVSLTLVSTFEVAVNYATMNGTATAGSDYTATSGTLTFAPGETSKFVYVPVLGDSTSEPNETLTLNLSNANGATIDDGAAVGTIVNDDVAIAVDDVSVVETNNGTVDAVFYIYLTAPSSSPVSFNFATANGTASAGSDYDSFSAPYTFAPGQTGVLVHVIVHGDTNFESNETFTMNLSNVVGAAVADGVGVATILNDDVAPTFSINDVSGLENQGTLVFTVTLSTPQTTTKKVKYATASGTAKGGNSGTADFVNASGTLTFSPGQTTKTVTVTLRNDSTVEPNEVFFVNLSSPTGATIADPQGLGTILNDDGGALAMGDSSSQDGGAGAPSSPRAPALIRPSRESSTEVVSNSHEPALVLTTDRRHDLPDSIDTTVQAVTLADARLARVEIGVGTSTQSRWDWDVRA